MITPLDNDFALSAIYLSGIRSPGVVTLSGHDRPKNWDIQKAKGSTGSSTVLNGDEAAQFEATFSLAYDEAVYDGTDDFTLWEEFQRLIESTTAGPKPFALPVYHPDLARNHITQVTNGGVGGMLYDGRGGATVKVKFLEFLPPKSKPAAKPTAKASSPAKPSKPDPNAAAKAELAALLAKAREP